MDGQTFATNTAQWAADRNITHGSTPARQVIKLLEEATELYTAILDGNINEIRDGVGDCDVVLRMIEEQTDSEFVDIEAVGPWSPTECINELMRRIGRLASRAMRSGSDGLHYPAISFAVDEVRTMLLSVAQCYGLTMAECRAKAWNDIKDRKGGMVSGVWVKESPAES